MTDKDIIDYFIDIKRCAIIAAKLSLSHLNLPSNIERKEYLETRFNDAEIDRKTGRVSYKSIIARIFWKIETRPTCKICGKPLFFKTLANPYGTWCSSKCQLSDREFINKRESSLSEEDRKRAMEKGKHTKLEKYGNENYNNREKQVATMRSKSPEEKSAIHDKRVATCLEKYGKEYAVITEEAISAGHTPEILKENVVKMKNTMFEKYGGYTFQSEELTKKVITTNLVKYGVERYTNHEKAVETLFNRTGYTNPYQIPEVRDKIDYNKVVETKRLTGKLNSSSEEKIIYGILIDLFGEDDIIYQYCIDDRYKNPNTMRFFSCDFYIKSVDLFIEYQGSQYHHDHPFDSSNCNDIKELENLIVAANRRRESDGEKINQYDNIIDTWTIRDPMKRKVALDNKIKLLEIWPTFEKFTKESISSLVNDFLKIKNELDD